MTKENDMTERERPEPPVDLASGLYRGPLQTVWKRPSGDRRPADADGRLLLDEAALSRTYTCMSCNKTWRIGDPRFVYFRFGPKGSPTEGKVVGDLGWFARCADGEACAHRRANIHSGVHPEALTLEDEARQTGVEIPALA